MEGASRSPYLIDPYCVRGRVLGSKAVAGSPRLDGPTSRINGMYSRPPFYPSTSRRSGFLRSSGAPGAPFRGGDLTWLTWPGGLLACFR